MGGAAVGALEQKVLDEMARTIQASRLVPHPRPAHTPTQMLAMCGMGAVAMVRPVSQMRQAIHNSRTKRDPGAGFWASNAPLVIQN